MPEDLKRLKSVNRERPDLSMCVTFGKESESAAGLNFGILIDFMALKAKK